MSIKIILDFLVIAVLLAGIAMYLFQKTKKCEMNKCKCQITTVSLFKKYFL